MPKRVRDTAFKSSLFDNKRTWNNYTYRLFEMAMSRGHWSNMPKSVDLR